MFAVLFLATVLGAAPQSQPAGTELRSSPKSAPVLRLEGEDITWDEYSRWLIENFGVRLATTFAGDHLVEREARRRGVDVTPAEVETELDSQFKTRIDGAFLGSKAGWLAELARLQRSEPGVRTQRKQEIGIDILTRKSVAVNRVVPEDKIVREWELSYGRGGRAYDLSMLHVHCEFLSLDKEESKEVKDRLRQEELDLKQQRALELRQRIVNGADFAAVAREASDDELSRTNGAKPRQPYRHYGWPKNFPEALDKLAVGEISQPIYAKGGWWVVRVDGLTVTPLEQVRAELVQRLEKIGPEQDETGTYRNALVDAAKIEILPTLFAQSGGDIEHSGLTPALSIDGELISRSAYAQWILRTRGESSWPNFVEHRVVINEARRRGVEVSDGEVRARTEDYIHSMILQEYKGSREGWLAEVKLRGCDEAQFTHDLDVRMRIELLCERLILLDRKITPEMVRARFEQLYGKDGKLTKARLILLNVPASLGPQGETREQMEVRLAASKESVRVKAQALANAVRDGADFSTLARQHSDDPLTAATGGLLDARFRPEQWPEPIATTVAGLDVGGVTDALEFGTAFAVIQVISREAASFDALKDDLAVQLRSQPPLRTDLNAYRNTLVQKAKIEVLPGMNP